jgi:uncharacterized protein (DUF58 family)
VNELINSTLEQSGPTLTRYAFLILFLATLPLILLAWRRRIFPNTTQIVAFAAPCAFTFLLLWDVSLLPIVVLVDAIVPLIALIDLFTLPGVKALSVQRETTRIASLRKNHRVTLHITNTSNRRVLAWIKDDVPQEFEAHPKEFILRLGPRSRTTVHYEMQASRRGAYQLEHIHVRFRSLLGFWQRFVAYPAESAIHVYPDMKQLSEYALLARTNRLSLMGVRRTRKVGAENDFERLRDYTPDDNYKFIDWRASARRRKLTVKDFQTSQSQRIVFLIDCGRLMTSEASGLSLLDHALNAAIMLSYVALRQGDNVGMIAFSDRIHTFVPPQGGMKHMNQLLHASFDRFPQLVESRYDEAFLYLGSHVRKRSLVVLISNIIDEVNAHQVHSYLSTLVGKHLPLGVLMRDHRLFDAADRVPENDAELFRAAAAAEILTWRHQVLRDLEHQGVLALDVFPEDMTAPLVNRYLEIKARHLL